MQNNNNKPAGSAKKVRGSSRKNENKKSLRQIQKNVPRSVGAAVHEGNRPIGMKNLMAHELSFLAGYIYVGNGTLGATDGIYFQDVGKTKINQASSNFTSLQMPFTPCPCSIWGNTLPTYVSDVMKHYARYRVKRASLELISLQPATSNSMLVQISPVRGAGDSADALLTTGTVAGATLANTIGMTGSKSATSWQGLSVDMTKYIAGGSGAAQNEFSTDPGNSLVTAGDLAKDRSIPAALVVSGQNNTTALRATQTHAIVYRFELDLLDFVAGVISSDSPYFDIMNPKPEYLRFLESIGGTGLLKLWESKKNRLLEEEFHKSGSVPETPRKL